MEERRNPGAPEIDEKTGQPLFTPRILDIGLPRDFSKVGENLYQNALDMLQRKQSLREAAMT